MSAPMLRLPKGLDLLLVCARNGGKSGLVQLLTGEQAPDLSMLRWSSYERYINHLRAGPKVLKALSAFCGSWP